MKYEFEGIGAVSATAAMVALAGSPLKALVAGPLGRIVFFALKLFFMAAASKGLILVNVGIADVRTIMEQGGFDGSWSAAEKAIKKIKDQGRELTSAEIKAIDQPVIDAFRKFATFGKLRNGGHS